METKLHSNWKRVGLTTLTVVVLSLSIPLVSMAGIFGMEEDYPGGELKAAFSMEDPGSESPARTYTITIKPVGDRYDVTETVDSPERMADDVSTGFGASGGGCHSQLLVKLLF